MFPRQNAFSQRKEGRHALDESSRRAIHDSPGSKACEGEAGDKENGAQYCHADRALNAADFHGLHHTQHQEQHQKSQRHGEHAAHEL